MKSSAVAATVDVNLRGVELVEPTETFLPLASIAFVFSAFAASWHPSRPAPWPPFALQLGGRRVSRPQLLRRHHAGHGAPVAFIFLDSSLKKSPASAS